MIREAELTRCAHCGTPFRPQHDECYCCQGCLYVSQVLKDDGFERFYELKGNTTLPPVGSKVFQDTETDWLETIQDNAEESATARVASAELAIEGISCLGCVWLIEALFKRQSGSSNIRIDARSGEIGLTWIPGHFNLPAFARELQQIGYRLGKQSAGSADEFSTRRLTFRLGLCGFFLMNTMLFTLPGYLGMGGDFFMAPVFLMLGALFATLSLVVGGGYFISRAWQALRTRVLHIDLPIALGLLAAYAGSMIGCLTGYTSLVYFDFVATFVFLMLAGRWLQEFALQHNRTHMQRQQSGPREVTLIGGSNDGMRVSVEAVNLGQRFSVRPGEVNPVAADLLESSGTISLEWINGEAEPVVWSTERPVPAGAINVGLHDLQFEARESWQQSLLAQLLKRPADNFRNQRLQTVLKGYIAIVLATAALGGLIWLALTADVLKATQVLISVLVVSCPCALGVALPLCDDLATSALRRAGLFIKSGNIWERMRRVRTVVFDKTGTLTMDIPRLVNPMSVRQLDPLSVQALFTLVEHNVHPLARSLRENLMAEHPRLTRFSRHEADTVSIEEHTGIGVSWTDAGGNHWTLGKPAWEARDDNFGKAGTRSVLRENGLMIAAFRFSEDVRDDAVDALARLRLRKLNTAILSGDSPDRVNTIAKQLKLPPEVARGECRPEDKARWIKQRAPGEALMIGDGANDSLAFDQAVCRGTPVVDRSILEASADFFFFGRSLRCLPKLFETARRRDRTVKLVFTAAVTYNMGAVGLCLAGQMHPLLAAILMPLSSIATLLISWIGLRSRN